MHGGASGQDDGSGFGIYHAIYFEVIKPQWVAEWNQLSGSLGGHNPCDSGAGEHVALRSVASRYGSRCRRLHPHNCACDGLTVAGLFARYVDHSRFAVLV